MLDLCISTLAIQTSYGQIFQLGFFVGIFYIKSKLFIYAFDETLLYQESHWLPSVTTESEWCTMHLSCICLYFGPTDPVVFKTGKQLVAKVLQTNAELLYDGSK